MLTGTNILFARAPGTYCGLQIVFTPAALEQTEERLFPASKNRSKRIHKKLVKRFGGEFRMKPTMWLYRRAGVVYVHPALRADLEAQMREPPR
jgi:hypothetical protein